MGSICQTSASKLHRVRVQAYPETGGSFSLIQLIGTHGTVLAQKRNFPGGVLEFEFAGSDQAGYVLARAFGPGDDPALAPDRVRQASITNPVYLHPAGFHVAEIQTSCTLRVPATSRWLGGTMEFQRADGRRIALQKVSAGVIRTTLPANARVVLKKPGLSDWNFSIAMENHEVEKLLSFLSSGQFLNDYRNLKQGEVPSEAFHLEEFRRRLADFEYTLD